DVRENALRRLDYLGYFGRDPRIAALLSGYRFAEEVGQYRLFVRASSAEAPGVRPVSESGTRDVLRTGASGGRALASDSSFLLHVLLFAILAGAAYAGERRKAQRDAAVSSRHGAV
ncbi:MAG: hypothetical protein ACAI18_18050, partial [Gemmatimonadales bacterium]